MYSSVDRSQVIAEKPFIVKEPPGERHELADIILRSSYYRLTVYNHYIEDRDSTEIVIESLDTPLLVLLLLHIYISCILDMKEK